MPQRLKTQTPFGNDKQEGRRRLYTNGDFALVKPLKAGDELLS